MGKKIKKVLLWILGIFFIIMFLLYFDEIKIPSIFILISGIMLLPPVNEYIKKKSIKKDEANEEMENATRDKKYENKIKNYNIIKNISIVTLALVFFANVPSSNETNQSNNNSQETHTVQEVQEIQEAQENSPIDQKQIDASATATITEKNGTYTGERVDGKKQGNGKYEWNDGSVYEGEFSDDKINGKGKLTIPQKDTYEGNFSNGKKNGQGTYTFANGDIYTGEWSDDKMSGQGKYTFANGDTYDGSFSDNKFNGQGTYTKGENKYTGTWKNNEYTK